MKTVLVVRKVEFEEDISDEDAYSSTMEIISQNEMNDENIAIVPYDIGEVTANGIVELISENTELKNKIKKLEKDVDWFVDQQNMLRPD